MVETKIKEEVKNETTSKKENMFVKAMKIVGKAIAAPFVLIYKGIKWLINKIKSLFNSKKVDDSVENSSKEEKSEEISFENEEFEVPYSEELQKHLDDIAAASMEEDEDDDDEDDESEEEDSKEEVSKETEEDEDDDEFVEDDDIHLVEFATTPDKTAVLSQNDPFDKIKPFLTTENVIENFAEKIKEFGFEVSSSEKDKDGKMVDTFFSYKEKPSVELRCFYDVTDEKVPIMVIFYISTYKEVKKEALKSLVARLNIPMDANVGKEGGSYDGFKTTAYYGDNNSLISVGISNNLSSKQYFVCVSNDR